MDEDLKTKLLWVGGGVLGVGAVWIIYSQMSKKDGSDEDGVLDSMLKNKTPNPLVEKKVFVDRNDLKWSISVTGIGGNWDWTAKYAEAKDNPYYKKKSFSGTSTSKAAAFSAAGKVINEAVDPLIIAMPF